MKPSTQFFRSARLPFVEKAIYTPPTLGSITMQSLPNNDFEKRNQYHVKRSKTGAWPVYKKIQNTRISTEVKRVQGNVELLAQHITTNIPGYNSKKNILKINKATGEINIKGDFVPQIKSILEEASSAL